MPFDPAMKSETSLIYMERIVEDPGEDDENGNDDLPGEADF